MNKKIKIIKLSTVVWLSSVSMYAFSVDEHRIAYSKKDKVEVFAEKKNGEWCQGDINLHFVGDEGSDLSTTGLQPLLKKLSVVLPRECPAVVSVNLKATDRAGIIRYKAKASRKNGWVLDEIDDSVLAAGKSSGRPETPDKVVTSSEHQQQVRSETSRVPNKSDNLSLFAVNGWQPTRKADGVVIQSGVDDTVLTTADGCKLRYSGSQLSSVGEYKVETEGLACQEGYLAGLGVAVIKRSDGKRMVAIKARFINGYPLSERLAENLYPQSRFKQGYRDLMTVYLGSDIEHKAHHVALLRNNSRGIWFQPNSSHVYVITENEQSFLEENQLKSVMGNLYQTAVKRLNPENSYRLIAINILPGMTSKNDERLYEVSVSYNRYRRNNKFEFNWDRATNYVYQRKEKKRLEEKRLAEARQRELERKQREMESEYQRIKDMSLDRLIAYSLGQLDNVGKVNLGKLAATGQQVFIRVRVRVDDIESNFAEAGWPFPMVIDTDGELDSSGWYIVEGKLTASFDQRDELGLLVPQIELNNAMACDEEACGDFRDPIEAIRAKYNENDWLPAANRG